jgi:hypothetical protein
LKERSLKERTRERVPLEWAATQHDLGDALATLGERESGTAARSSLGQIDNSKIEGAEDFF